MSEFRSEVAFFHDATVHEAITSFVAAKRVVIFAGAGLTIDQTGLDWASLVRGVFASSDLSDLITPEQARVLTQRIVPIEAASIAERYFRKVRSKSKDASSALHNTIQGLLYGGSEWKGGLLTRNVIRSAIQFAEAGRDVTLVTTNYDVYLETEFERARDVVADSDPTSPFPAMQVYALGDKVREIAPTAGSSATIRLVYLHGRLPQEGKCDGRVAFSEQDYFELRPLVAETLTPIFSEANVLILGSGLSDPPLIAALQATYKKAGPSRLALLPVGSFRKDLSAAEIESLKPHLRARAEGFGVDLLIPDFYFQTAQFCEELTTALALHDEGMSYQEAEDLRYGKRLQTWWKSWRQCFQDHPELDEAVYEELVGTLSKIREEAKTRSGVKDSKNEVFRLDVWVRWDPSDAERCLGLWANSVGVRRDFSSIRTANLSLGSPFESIATFINGRPQLTDGQLEGTRWKTFLSVPVERNDGTGGLPVGVITLSSMTPRRNSRINGTDASLMSTLVDILLNCGTKIFSPDWSVPKIEEIRLARLGSESAAIDPSCTPATE